MMRHPYDDTSPISTRAAYRARAARRSARAKAAEAPTIEPWLIGVGLLSVLAALALSLQAA